ncbi:MAG TPA: CpaD family pilus assembly protein [Novosphingobium sp.]|nr:CpaD family pilus assembly protein [Novosphingobium sp.]
MRSTLFASAGRTAAGGLVLALGLALAGCGGVPSNRSMNSVHQPVVERTDYTLDVTTSGSGLAYGEQARLAGWFDAMGLKYGDRVTIDDPSGSAATRSVVEALASRHGILLGEAAPQTAGYVTTGTARVIVTRSRASVPSCPDWSAKSDFNPTNGLSSNYGCATNTNLAAMVANPEDLVRGADDSGMTTAATATKAIDAYRAAPTTGKGSTVAASGTAGGN